MNGSALKAGFVCLPSFLDVGPASGVPVDPVLQSSPHTALISSVNGQGGGGEGRGFLVPCVTAVRGGQWPDDGVPSGLPPSSCQSIVRAQSAEQKLPVHT